MIFCNLETTFGSFSTATTTTTTTTTIKPAVHPTSFLFCTMGMSAEATWRAYDVPCDYIVYTDLALLGENLVAREDPRGWQIFQKVCDLALPLL